MQNRYTGDVGDFGKYALLKALVCEDLRLGVHWYLNADEETNTDGRFTDYPRLRECDPALFDSLHAIVRSGDRCVAAVQRDGILPPGTQFFSKPLTMRDLPQWDRAGRALRRSRWNAAAHDALVGTDLIFMDPDNGLAGKAASPLSNAGPKYVFPEEIVPYLRRGQSLVIYHHQTREKGGLAHQIESKAEMLRNVGAPSVSAFIFRRFSVRVYFLVPAPAHAAVLAERSRQFIDSTLWGTRGHFEVYGGRAIHRT